MENRSGLVVDIEVTQSNGRAEREVTVKLLDLDVQNHGLLSAGEPPHACGFG